MARFVLFRKAQSGSEDDVLETLSEAADIEVIDQEFSRAILVEAPADAFQQLRALLPGWTIAPETEHPAPEPVRKRVRKKETEESG